MCDRDMAMEAECPDDIDDGPEVPLMMYMPLFPDRQNMTIPDCKVRSKRARVEESEMIELVIRPAPGSPMFFEPFSLFLQTEHDFESHCQIHQAKVS